MDIWKIMRNDEHQPISKIIEHFVSKNNLQKGLDKVHVREAWETQMGPAIKKYTTGMKLDSSGTLYVALSSSVLREELSYGKEKIITMLNKTLGKELIKKIVLR